MEVFKYSPIINLTLENLRNHELWFSAEFEDDPNDNNLQIGEFRFNEFLTSSIEFFKQNPGFYEKYLKIFQESGISKNPNQDFSVEEMMQTMKRTFHGITCFTTTDSNEYMWEKFADYHSGFCLCFETDLDSDFFKELYPVNYENELPKIDLMDNNLAKQMEIFSLTKSSKYLPEDEIRLLKHKSGLHKYKSESLKNITLGKNIKDEEKIMNLISKFYNHKILIKNG